jgi:hypothetical protein
MILGMYLNALICFFAALFCFNTARYVFKIFNKNRREPVEISYAIFWFLAGMNWLFFCVSLILFKLNAVGIALFLNQYIIQVFAVSQVVAASYFVIRRLIKNNKIYLLFFIVFCIVSIFAIIFDFRPGSVFLTLTTDFSFEYAIDSIYWQIFQLLYFIIVLFVFLDFVINLYYWFKKVSIFDNKYFFATFSLLVYSMIGYFEQSGITITWVSLLFRLSIILCAYLAYISYKDNLNFANE